jgi:hypothetical protein
VKLESIAESKKRAEEDISDDFDGLENMDVGSEKATRPQRITVGRMTSPKMEPAVVG